MKKRKMITCRCWLCNSPLSKNGDCTNIGCMPVRNWRYEINYGAAPENLESYLLKRNYSKQDASFAKQELSFQLSSCKKEEHMRNALTGFCRKYDIPFSAFSHYSYKTHTTM